MKSWKRHPGVCVIAGLLLTEFQTFFQPYWRNRVRFRVYLKHLQGMYFQNFFNHDEEITFALEYIWSTFKEWIYDFFQRYRKGITYVLESIWSNCKEWIKNFFQPWWNHVRFRVNLKHLQGLNFKIFFNHGEQIV